MKVLKIDPYSGISGDMFLGSLVGLLGCEDELKNLPETLGLDDVEVTVQKVVKGGISATKVDIKDNSKPVCRHLSDILGIIDSSSLNKVAKALSGKIFKVLGEAEAFIHGTSIDKIHFHEVGAVDSILDIVGAALLLSKLGDVKVYSSPICTGFGTVKCAHGELPVPAPATAKLLEGMPVYAGKEPGEMVTPTGAAILKVLSPEFGDFVSAFNDSSFGAGSKDLDSRANCLRISIGESLEEDTTYIVQTNIDDMSGELLGDSFQRKVLELGALDITLSQMIMKKGRPGVKLEVLVQQKDLKSIRDLILNETSTFGVRYFKVDRDILKREFIDVPTKYGSVKSKVGYTPSGAKRVVPEFEELNIISSKKGISTQVLYQEVLKNL